MAKKTFVLSGILPDFLRMVAWCETNISTVGKKAYLEPSKYISDSNNPLEEKTRYASVFSAEGWKVSWDDGETFTVTLDNKEHIVMALLSYRSGEL